MSKIIVYTAITGDKDKPRTDIPCFNLYDEFKRPVLNAKIYKVLAHQYTDCDYSIWIDGNIELLVEPEKLVKEWLKNEADIGIWKHFARDCIYDEGAVIRHYAILPNNKPMIDQLNKYEKEGYPKHNGLAECNVIVRKHSKATEAFNNMWWSEICSGCSRDQISFPYVASKLLDVKVNYIEGNVRDHPWFRYRGHLK